MAAQRTLDVLIITALRSEYEAVLQVDAGAPDGSAWATRAGPLGHEIAFRVFSSEPAGGHLEVAVTWATDMGGVATASVAERLIAAYSPRCLAMCGVCAGRRGDVNVGDVIVADRLWMYDAGKLKAEYDAEGNRFERVQGDMLTYNLRPDWKRAAESFGVPEELRPLLATRPRSCEVQADWILERLAKNEDPHEHPELEQKAPNFSDVIELLWKKKLVEDATFSLTEAGQKRINRLLLKHKRSLPEPEAFHVRIGPIGSGNKVVQDPHIFDRLAESMRKVLGLEMEAMAIGAVAHEHQDAIRHMIVMKGVMDHADDWKSDAVKQFAARASAECLIAFLRRNLPPEDRFTDILDPGTSTKPETPGPSALLNARYEYIPFYEKGRADILQQLDTFCDGPERVDLWLIHGEGGMGKTRLFIEACRRFREKRGWVAGFLGKSATVERFNDLVESDLPALVVIDYAESRSALTLLLDSLARKRLSGKRAGALRVVLLARNADDWWTSLVQRDGMTNDFLKERAPTGLASLVHSEAERVEVVGEVASRFAGILKKPVPSSPLPGLEDARFERALFLHIAALAWVNGIPVHADTLMNDILEHEERFWITQASAPQDRLGEEIFVKQMRGAVAAMTLCGGIASAEAGKVLLHRVNGKVDERLLLFLRWLYPPAEEGRYTSPLEPDLLGEGMVWRTMTKVREQGDSPTGFLGRVFQGEREQVMETGFVVLGRLSVEHAEDVRGWIGFLLAEDLEGRAVAALEAAKTLGERTALAGVGMELAEALKREGTLELAGRLEKAGVPDATVSLREVRAWVTEMRLQLFPREAETEEARAARAGELNNLGNRQSALGQREAALGFTAEAVEILRALAKARSDVFLPDLAMSLNNLGNRQSDLGQREAALGSTAEAVEIYRALAKARPDVFLPDLAISLNNLGVMQSDLGQREAALGSTAEAVEEHRALAKDRPDVFLPVLAGSLNNLGARQSELGQREAALGSTAEAVEIRRALAKDRPDVFLPDLAMSLNNLGAMQSELGQREAALGSTAEAVAIYRALAKDRPDVFLPDLAISLNNLGARQSALGQREAALGSTAEAVEIRRALAKDRPDVFLPVLAGSLINLAIDLLGLERAAEALPLAQESLDLLWPVYERYPKPYEAWIRTMFQVLEDLRKTLNIEPDATFAERRKRYHATSGA